MADGRYFKLREMACRDGTPYPAKWAETRWPALRDTLDAIRERWGSPIRIVSGYRSPAYNTRIGGARASQHMEGRAADLQPMNPSLAPDLHAAVLAMYRAGKLPQLGGLGEYGTFTHVDTRPTKRLVRWSGSRAGS